MTHTSKMAVLIYLLAHAITGYSQLDSIHYLPPMHSRTESQIGDHFLYLSTPETTPFTITLKDGAGNILATPLISNSSPFAYQINSTYSDVVIDPVFLNTVLTKGIIATAQKQFYMNF